MQMIAFPLPLKSYVDVFTGVKLSGLLCGGSVFCRNDLSKLSRFSLVSMLTGSRGVLEGQAIEQQ